MVVWWNLTLRTLTPEEWLLSFSRGGEGQGDDELKKWFECPPRNTMTRRQRKHSPVGGIRPYEPLPSSRRHSWHPWKRVCGPDGETHRSWGRGKGTRGRRKRGRKMLAWRVESVIVELRISRHSNLERKRERIVSQGINHPFASWLPTHSNGNQVNKFKKVTC